MSNYAKCSVAHLQTDRTFIIYGLGGDYDSDRIIAALHALPNVVETNWGMDLTVTYRDDDRLYTVIEEEIERTVSRFIKE